MSPLSIAVLFSIITVAQASGCPQDWIAQGDFCYHVTDTLDIIGKALQECQDLGANIPVIKSAQENDFILNLAKDSGEPWLAMHLEGDSKFYWIDGTSVADTFSAWNNGEPHNLDFDQDCAFMYVTGDRKGKWNNTNCEVKRLAICQKHI